VVIHPDGDGVAVKANMGGSTSPVGLEGMADSLMLGEACEAAPLLEEEAEGILDATTNPEGGQGKSPEVSLGFWFFCVVPRLPRTNWLELALHPLARTRSSAKGEAGDREVPQKDPEE
jgi:hypothetical protein